MRFNSVSFSRTALLVAFLFSVVTTRTTTVEASLNVELTNGDTDNPLQDTICSIFACNSNGNLEMIDYFAGIANDLTNVSLNFGGGDNGTRKKQRKLRGSD